MSDPIAFLSKCNKNKDVMYYHQAITADDHDNIIDTTVTEFNNHTERKHWSIVDQTSVPQDSKVLPSVWLMKHKRDITTQSS